MAVRGIACELLRARAAHTAARECEAAGQGVGATGVSDSTAAVDDHEGQLSGSPIASRLDKAGFNRRDLTLCWRLKALPYFGSGG